MSSDVRHEFICQQCGRSRCLSAEEADADGWRIQFGAGIICPWCAPSYGIPLALSEPGTRGRKIYDAVRKHPDVSVNLVVEAVDQGYIP